MIQGYIYLQLRFLLLLLLLFDFNVIFVVLISNVNNQSIGKIDYGRIKR